jgi:hypothetical protein
MNTYRLELNLGSQTLVEADCVMEHSRKLSFYRENAMYASWARSSVKHYECLPVSLDDIREALATGYGAYEEEGENVYSEDASPAGASRIALV